MPLINSHGDFIFQIPSFAGYNTKLHRNRLIQGFIAGILFSLFALSITPKQWLHDVLTGHKHNIELAGDDREVRQSNSYFQCAWHLQDLVSPFTLFEVAGIEHPQTLHRSAVTYFLPGIISTAKEYSSLRGPPSVV